MSSEIAIQNGSIRIDPAIAEEWPVAPHGLDQRRVALRDHDFL
jgi:hypothetical protein